MGKCNSYFYAKLVKLEIKTINNFKWIAASANLRKKELDRRGGGGDVILVV